MLRELSRTFTFLMVAALTKSDSPVTLRSRMSKYTVAVVCVFALGAALRLTAFFHDRSLWLDEAMLARNVISRSYSELARPLAYHQGARLGIWRPSRHSFLLKASMNTPYEPCH